jgi:hypothetical protein
MLVSPGGLCVESENFSKFKFSHLEVTQEGLGDELDHQRGTTLRSILRASRALNTIKLSRCDNPKLGLEDLASVSGCQSLNELWVTNSSEYPSLGGIDITVFSSFVIAANNKLFNCLKVIVIEKLEGCNTESVFHLYSFLLQNDQLQL